MRILEKQIKNYRLTTAEILYHLPNYPELLQTFIWQNLDLAPDFPVLKKFLTYWENNLDGRLHSVQVANTKLIKPKQVRNAEALLMLH
ncbi:MAG: Usg family protein [Rhodospirillaceae bacterium]